MIQPANSPACEDSCPAHGTYTSTLLQVRAGGEWLQWWTGCPACSRQHFLARRGQGSPDLPAPHRPRST